MYAYEHTITPIKAYVSLVFNDHAMVWLYAVLIIKPAICCGNNHLDINLCLHQGERESSCCGEYNYFNEEMFEEKKAKKRNRVQEVNLESGGVLLQARFI